MQAEKSTKKSRAALMIAEGSTKSDIAKQLKVSRSTVYNWLEEAAFKKEVNRQRSEILLLVEQRKRALINRSLGVLEETEITPQLALRILEKTKTLDNPELQEESSFSLDITDILNLKN